MYNPYYTKHLDTPPGKVVVVDWVLMKKILLSLAFLTLFFLDSKANSQDKNKKISDYLNEGWDLHTVNVYREYMYFTLIKSQGPKKSVLICEYQGFDFLLDVTLTCKPN